MAQKNRPTLKQQYDDYINRVAPFDGNPLIQDSEDNQVTQDALDSLLNNTDSSDLINSPSAAINLDFSAFDLYRINSSGSGETDFNITINNLGTGQVARVHIIKKNNDKYSFTNAVLGQISNLSQTGTILSFFVHNVNNVLVAYADVTIAKTNSTTDSSSDKLATAKAVSDLNTALSADITNGDAALEASKLDKSRFDIDSGTPGLITKVIEIGDWNMDSTLNIAVNHGLTFSKIRTHTVTIRNDANTTNELLIGADNSGNAKGSYGLTTTQVLMVRTPTGIFDSTDFDATPFNRGWITITSEQ